MAELTAEPLACWQVYPDPRITEWPNAGNCKITMFFHKNILPYAAPEVNDYLEQMFFRYYNPLLRPCL